MRFKNLRPLIRAGTIVGLVLLAATGVTYAALQSQSASLQGNTITSASASLQIGTSPTSLGSAMPGFSFGNVEPGATAASANDRSFYLDNNGSVPLDLKLAIAPGMSWPIGVDVSKIWFQVTAPDGTTKRLALSSLYDSYNTGFTDTQWTLASGQSGQYKIQALIDSAANGSTATTSGFGVNNINLVFMGTSVNAS